MTIRTTEVLSLKRQNILFISVTTFFCIVSFYRPVLEAGGGIVIVFLAIFSMLNPFSASIYIAASQTLADAPGLGFTPAQLSAVGFIIALFYRNYLSSLPSATFECLKWMAPFMIFFAAKRIIAWNDAPYLQSELFAMATCLMIAVYYREGVQNKWLWFLCLCIGALISISAYILYISGFEAVVQAGAHGERDRLYLGRAANATSIGLVAGLGGMLAIWLAVQMRTLRIVPQHWERWVSLLMLVSCWLALLSVFATGSRAGAVGALLAIGSTLVAEFFLSVKLYNRGVRKKLLLLILLVVIGGAALASLPQTGFTGAFERMLIFSQEQAQQSGANVLIAGRSEAWYPAFLDFLNSPFLGIMPNQWLYTTYGSHNVFIGVAKSFGIVGLILYLVYFAGPTILVNRILGLRLALPFTMFIVGTFITFNSLDFSNYKTFHVYNGIMIGIILEYRLKNQYFYSYRSHYRNVGPLRTSGLIHK